MSQSVSNRGAHHYELDLLRGIAVICMIVNHCGLAWGGSETRTDAMSVLVFMGEFAPVLFFFTSGVGNGLRSAFGPDAFWDTLYKAGLLFFADWFLYPVIHAIYFDFLAFIGFSLLVLHLVHSLKHGVLVCGLLLGFVVFGRFGLGVALRGVLPQDHWILCLLGVGHIGWTSYSPLPWLAYPLAGYLAGRWLRGGSAGMRSLRRVPLTACAATALLGAAAGALMAMRGMPIFRWGTMSVGFFVASVAAIAAASALAIAAARSKQLTRLLATGGPASFAAVPIHYGLVALLGVHAAVAGRALWSLLLLPVALVVLECARQYGALAADMARRARSQLGLVAIGLSLALAAAVAAVTLPAQAKVFTFLGQLVICGLLTGRVIQKRKVSVPMQRSEVVPGA